MFPSSRRSRSNVATASPSTSTSGSPFRWGIELDIHPEHRSVDGHHRDARRFRSLHESSWQIEPVTEQDMLCVERLADELTALYHERACATRVSSDPMWRAPELESASALG
jgi:hypothetical protein